MDIYRLSVIIYIFAIKYMHVHVSHKKSRKLGLHYENEHNLTGLK